MVRIFIVEDHPVVRRGYVAFLEREPDIEICGEATMGQEALQSIPACRPDVVVLDVSLPGDMNGIDLLRKLKRLYPDLLVLVVSGNEAEVYGDLVVQLGAWDYIMKGNVAAFMQAIRTVVDHVQRAGHAVSMQ